MIKIVVRDGCPHCEYILSHISLIRQYCDVEVISVDELDDKLRKKVKAIPAIIKGRKIDYVTGSTYGLLKIIMMCQS